MITKSLGLVVVLFSLIFLSSCSTSKKVALPKPPKNKPIEVCTLRGCGDKIIVSLPKGLKLKPDTYTISTQINNNKTNAYRFKLIDTKSSNCTKKGSLKSSTVRFSYLHIETASCESNQNAEVQKLTKFNTFTLFEINRGENRPETIAINLVDSNNKVLFRQRHKINFDQSKPFYPNGERCGGACFTAHLQLK